MPGRAVQEILSNSRVWSGLTVLLELSRAFSYWFRPSTTRAVVEDFIPYHGWAVILVVSSVMIATGSIFCRFARLALFGHLIGVFCYFTFGSSILLGALLYGLGWASMGSLYLVAVLHFGLAVAVGDRLGRYRQEEEALGER